MAQTKRKWHKPELWDEYKRLYLNGWSTHKIATYFNISSATPWLILKKMGLLRSISKQKLCEKNPQWKGDNVGKVALHEWVTNRFPKPKLCMRCQQKPPYDLANISQKYKRDLSDWEWLCRKCHMIKDGRIYNLNQYNKKYA